MLLIHILHDQNELHWIVITNYTSLPIILEHRNYIAISVGILTVSRYNGDTKTTTTNMLIHIG